MREKVKAIAFPGIPVIFAEGIREPFEERISIHNSIGMALTDINETARTETTVGISEKLSFLVNGKPIDKARGRGMLKIAEIMLKKSKKNIGLKIESNNYNILTGSSDSGAVALIIGLNKLLDLNLKKEELLNIARYGSETAFRSLYGGLTEYIVENPKNPRAIQIATPNELNSRLSILAINFQGQRFSADQLHKSVVTHPNYPLREKIVKTKIEMLKINLAKNNILGVLELMENDAKMFHTMVATIGMRVIKSQMKELCNFVEELRNSGLSLYWNVAGGNGVYIFCLKEDSKEVESNLLNEGWDFSRYKVADGARLL